MKNQYYTKKEILESKQLIKEDTLETALMIAGFVPVIGEVADIALICVYLWRKEYLYAGLMLIALIPTVGDFIAKPIIRLLKGAGEAGSVALKGGGNLLKYAETHPEFAAKYIKIGDHLNNPLIKKTISGIREVPVIGQKAAGGMEMAIAEHKGVISQLKNRISTSRPVQLGKSIGSEISTKGNVGFLKTIAGKGPVATGMKGFFRNEKLAQYIEKNGKAPETWLSHWWNVVRPARGARKDMFRSFIGTNHLLDFFHLPSLDAFEEKFQNDAEFRKQLANNPEFSQYVQQSTSPDELNQVNQMSMTPGNNSSGGNNFFGNIVGLGMIKQLAQSL
jgi:hypothetical protein